MDPGRQKTRAVILILWLRLPFSALIRAHGRDILRFASLVNAVRGLSAYEELCKVHAKHRNFWFTVRSF